MTWHIPEGDTHFPRMLAEGTYQKAQRDTALSYVDSFDGTAVDIGAHIGTWAVDLAKRFDRVVCFEPAPENIRCLRKNIIKFGCSDKITIHECALSDSNSNDRVLQVFLANSGENTIMNDNPMYNWGSANNVKIITRTLDSYNLNDVRFIKSDVQFHEHEVLLGAVDTVKRCRPVLCIELIDRNEFEKSVFDNVTQLLYNINYNLVAVNKKEHVFMHEDGV